MDHADGIREICSQEAPALEHFEFGIVDLPSPATIQELVRTAFFKGQAPMLRAFSIFEVPLPWSLIPCGQLTQLKITLREISTTDASSMGNFNELIGQLSIIEDSQTCILFTPCAYCIQTNTTNSPPSMSFVFVP